MSRLPEDTSGYASDPGKAGERTVLVGEREFYYQLAREKSPPVDAFATRTLHQMADADFAKAWSLLDFVIHKEGKDGQQWLRDACALYGMTAGFVNEWRK